VKPPFVVHTEASLGWGGQEIRVLSEMAGMMACGHRLLRLCPAFKQAMAMGLPVLGTPEGSIPGIVTDGETGMLVPSRDVAKLPAARA